MQLAIPRPSLVVLIGPSGTGKTSFAQAHFRPAERISLERDDGATPGPSAEQLQVVSQRLASGQLTVIDAANLIPEQRRALLAVAKAHDIGAVAIVFNLPERLCRKRNQARHDPAADPQLLHRQFQAMRGSLGALEREGFRLVYMFQSVAEVDAARINRQPLAVDKRDEHGPFDIIGDIHGCAEELRMLLAGLGYAEAQGSYRHPAGRRAIFLGDLVDRGPDTPGVLRIVMGMVAAGAALCLPGNHDIKLLRKLRGRDVRIAHGLAESLAQLAAEPPEFVAGVANFLDGLTSHYLLDEGRLVVAHAGMKQEYQGRDSPRARSFALYGEITGEVDQLGLPLRLNWAADYHGPATVVYGHTPVAHPSWQNRTINIDTGCVFGGRLTALRYPEGELCSVPALQVYAESRRVLAEQPEED